MPGRGVGGAHSTDDGKDNKTLLLGKEPCFAQASEEGKSEGMPKANHPVDKAQELQRALYRAAKQSATR